jgi:hypothetical protein
MMLWWKLFADLKDKILKKKKKKKKTEMFFHVNIKCPTALRHSTNTKHYYVVRHLFIMYL